MSSEKYIGLDVHQATISVAVMDSTGKLIMESILETKASTILEFLAGLRGPLSVTFEEGAWAAWKALGFNLTVGGSFDAAFGRAFAWRVLDLNYSHSWVSEVHSISASNGLQLRPRVVLRVK